MGLLRWVVASSLLAWLAGCSGGGGPRIASHGRVASSDLVGLVVSVGGIDAEGATALIKVVYGVPAGEELPGLLPFAFGMTFERID